MWIYSTFVDYTDHFGFGHKGASIGGSDTIQELDEKGELQAILEEAGLIVKRS